MNRSKSDITLHLVAAAALVLFAAANLVGANRLWGFSFLGYFPLYWAYMAVGLAVVLTVPGVSRALKTVLDRLSETIQRSMRRQIVLVAVAALVVVPLFVFFPSATTLLGDGSLRKNQVFAGLMWLPTEVLDFLVHAVLYQVVFRPLAMSVVDCYRAVSALSGVVFVVGAFRLARYLSQRQFVLVFMIMISSGLTVLFFGYVESYSILAALLPYIVLCGLKVLDRRAPIWSFITWCAIAALLHSVAVVLFSMALAVVLLPKNADSSSRARRMNGFLTTIVLMLIAGAYAAKVAGVGGIGRYLMPLFPEPDYRQGILTINHWLNLLNWLVLCALPLFVLGVVVLRGRGGAGCELAHRGTYAVWLAVPSLLFMFLFVPQLGGPRDWDLFALPAFLLVVAALVAWLDKSERPLPHQVVPLVLVALCNTAGFVAVNSSVVKSTDRFAEIIEVSKFKNVTKEYVVLMGAAEYHPEIADRRVEFALNAWRQPPYTRKDSICVLETLGDAYLAQAEGEPALHYLTQLAAIDTTDVSRHLTLLQAYDRFGSRDQRLAMAQMLERRFPQEARALMEAGITYQQLGETDRGRVSLERAFVRDSTDLLVLLNYGILQFQQGAYGRSLELLGRVLAADPDNFLATYYIASSHSQMGDSASAGDFVSRAEALAGSSAESQLVADLKRTLGGR